MQKLADVTHIIDPTKCCHPNETLTEAKSLKRYHIIILSGICEPVQLEVDIVYVKDHLFLPAIEP